MKKSYVIFINEYILQDQLNFNFTAYVITFMKYLHVT